MPGAPSEEGYNWFWDDIDLEEENEEGPQRNGCSVNPEGCEFSCLQSALIIIAVLSLVVALLI